MTVEQLALALGAKWEGDGSRELKRVATLEDAGPQDLSFLSSAKFLAQAQVSRAACLLVPETFPNSNVRTVIRAANPRRAVAEAIARIHPSKRHRPGIHPTAVIAASARVA